MGTAGTASCYHRRKRFTWTSVSVCSISMSLNRSPARMPTCLDRSPLYLHREKVDALAESSVAPVAIHVELDDSAERYGGLE